MAQGPGFPKAVLDEGTARRKTGPKRNTDTTEDTNAEKMGQVLRPLAQEYVSDGKFEPVIEELFTRADVDYLQVNSTTAGCFTFRIERDASHQKNVEPLTV
jgi:hypothetical protein